MTAATAPPVVWTDYHVNLKGGPVVGTPGVTVNAEGRNAAFVRTEADELWLIPQDYDCRTWNTWRQIGGAVIGGDPVPILGVDGLMHIFYRSPDNNLWVVNQTTPGKEFDPPLNLTSGCMSDPSIAMNGDGRITAVYRGSDNAAWQITQANRTYNAWSKAASLGGGIKGRPAVARSGDGKLSVFARGGDDGIWFITQVLQNNPNSWTPWATLGGKMISDLVAVLNADQRISVLYTGGNDGVWHVAQQMGGTSGYQFPAVAAAHTSLGGTVVGRPSATLAADGRMLVFATAKSDKQIMVAEQTAINGAAFSAFTAISGDLRGDQTGGGTPSVCAPILLTIGTLDAFYRGHNTELWYAPQA